MNARFKVTDVTRVSGRPVVLGETLDGSIRVGMQTQPLPIDNRYVPLHVTTITPGGMTDNGRRQVALMFDRDVGEDALRTALAGETVLELSDRSDARGSTA